jgi:hypothetical protein
MYRLLTTVVAAALIATVLVATPKTEAKSEDAVKVLRHIVLFKFKDTAPAEDVQKIVDAFVALEGKIDLIADFEWGTNVSKENLDKGLTHGFNLTFKTQEDLDAYIVHPDHKAFVALLDGVLEDVCVFDYWTN